MKVAINRCYGGFGLSDKAFSELLIRKGVDHERTKSKYDDFGDNFYKAGHLNDDDYYLSVYDYTHDRSDKDLIDVIEEMGEEAWGGYAELAIVDIPDDVEYTIEEYDGIEWVAEKHRTWR